MLKRVLIALARVVAFWVLLIGGIYAVDRYQHYQMVKIVKSEEAHKAFDECLESYKRNKEDFPYADKMKSYKVDYSSIKKNPMFGTDITLIVKDNKGCAWC
ncbi:DUF1310 family protein [Ligilactobacillus equi]|uniref:Uncharacterized protein n=1 Tax=Ligilactobacillus equi DPC 6820 TaxID=1392007 RepID=V7HZ77_9LACO|nr:DUF1310 family protein [Ligilactobacillus equi]ETA74595.1 hypothetical protein LEQ_1962c [Ligilactobacillus equi DPC 6820]